MPVLVRTSLLFCGLIGLVACSLESAEGDDAAEGGAGSGGKGGASAAGSAGMPKGGSAGMTASGGSSGTGAPAGGSGGTTSAGSGGAGGSTAGTLGAAGKGGAAGAPGGAGGSGGALGGAGSGGSATGGLAGAGGGGKGGAGKGGAAAGGAGGAAGGAGSGGGGGSAGSAGKGGFEPCPTNDEPCVILPFGDSITDGIGVSGGGSYRIELFSKALEAGQSITFVGSLQNGPQMVDNTAFPRRHEGHSGWKIAQLNPLIPDPAFDAGVPHIVLLHIGTNDIAQNDNLGSAPMRLGTLIDDIVEAAPEALVVVAKIIPLSSGSNAVTTYNNAIPDIVEARAGAGKHVIMVDQNMGFPTNELADGVHPNAAGYARMAGVWYEAIKGYLR
jgi:lysophospholipase L1-like esterase